VLNGKISQKEDQRGKTAAVACFNIRLSQELVENMRGQFLVIRDLLSFNFEMQ
jgi:hypothetical protein